MPWLKGEATFGCAFAPRTFESVGLGGPRPYGAPVGGDVIVGGPLLGLGTNVLGPRAALGFIGGRSWTDILAKPLTGGPRAAPFAIN